MIHQELGTTCNGSEHTMATMVGTSHFTQDVLTICARAFKRWGDRHLSDWAKKDINEIKFKALDDIIGEVPEGTLFHELTHAEAYFGVPGIMGKIVALWINPFTIEAADVSTWHGEEDESINGKPAYRFSRCKKLGQAEAEETDVKRNRALRNAGELSCLWVLRSRIILLIYHALDSAMIFCTGNKPLI